MLKQSVLLFTTVLSFTQGREGIESPSTAFLNFAVPFLERARNWNCFPHPAGRQASRGALYKKLRFVNVRNMGTNLGVGTFTWIFMV